MVVAQIVARMRGGEARASALAEVIRRPHLTLQGHPRLVSQRTVYRWLAAFKAGGLAALEPAGRKRTSDSVILPRDLLRFLRTGRAADPDASIPELIRRAREHGFVEPDEQLDRTTVWRAMKRMGVATSRRKALRRERDSRRFAWPHRMQMVLCDGKHFRAGATRKKRVALFFLDDASRYGLHVVVGTSENTTLFLRGLHEMVARHGLFDVLYLDHGPGFISDDTVAVVANLGLLLHGEVAYPQGHGKIEKFNQTAKHDILRHLADPRTDPNCGALELRLRHYLAEVYNQRPHASIGNIPPAVRWQTDDRALRFPDDTEALHRKFLVTEQRRVSHDHVVRVGPDHLEVPRGLRGQRIDIYRHAIDGTVSVLHDGRLVQVHPVDLAANAADRRGRPAAEAKTEHTLPTSAAGLAADRDLGPVVGPDGGFPDKE
jgi:putative transposase